LTDPAGLHADRLRAILLAAVDLYKDKSRDYQAPHLPPLLGLKLSAELGVAPWKATLIRLIDKLTLIAAYARNGEFHSHDETLQESLLDVICYAGLTAILLEDLSDRVDDSLLQVLALAIVEHDKL
jgi:hypothetical protein